MPGDLVPHPRWPQLKILFIRTMRWSETNFGPISPWWFHFKTVSCWLCQSSKKVASVDYATHNLVVIGINSVSNLDEDMPYVILLDPSQSPPPPPPPSPRLEEDVRVFNQFKGRMMAAAWHSTIFWNEV